MTNNHDDKRLNDEELEAVAGGVTQSSMPATVGTATPFSQMGTAINTGAPGSYFAEHSESGATTAANATYNAQTAAAVQSIYGGSGQPVPSTGSSSNVPHVADPNQMIGTGLNKVGYNIYE